jgi:predicted RNase H-like HicB family nuclease
VAKLAASYSTTVAGKNYSGSVEESGGTYTASVPDVPGASASGSSVQSAENNLNIKLDILA